MGNTISIHKLTEANNVEGIRQLLASNPGAVNELNQDGRSPLFLAAEKNNKVVAELLITAGANVNLTDHYGYTPIYIAVIASGREVIEVLLAAGATVETSEKIGFSPLYMAVIYGSKEAAEILIAAGANSDFQDKDDNSILHEAMRSGKTELVEVLLTAKPKPNINIQNKFGESPLYVAAEQNNEEVAKVLLAAGANFDLQDKHGFTPLLNAALRGHLEMCNMLLAAGARPNWASVAMTGDREGAKVLLTENPEEINKQDKNGKSSLHLAVQNNNKKIVTVLLANRANVDIEDQLGHTPLFEAATKEIADLLLSANAKVNHLSKRGRIPLHEAACLNRKEVAESLLSANSSIDVFDQMGYSPIQCAVINKSKEVTEVLLAAGANAELSHHWMVRTASAMTKSGAFCEMGPVLENYKKINADINENLSSICLSKTRKWNRSKIMIVGEGRAGKTSLANSIIGKTIKDTKSTVGINNLSCSINYADVSNGQWIEYDRPEKELETAIAIGIREKFKDKTKSQRNNCEQKLNNNKNIHNKKDDTTTIPNDNRKNGDKSTVNNKKISSESDKTDASILVTPKTDEINKRFVAKCLADNMQTSSDIIISLFDFGGQSVFDVIHHLFLTPYGVYIVVFNMTWVMKEVMETERATCWSRLEGWINSIIMHTSDFTDNGSSIPQSAPIVFVGTCKDKIASNAENFFEIISNKLHSKIEAIDDIVVRNKKEGLWFFPVNNNVGRVDVSISNMLQCIEVALMQSEYVIQEKPLIWLQALDKLKARKDITSYSMTEVREILASCGIEESGYSEVLSFFNKLGELLWINEDGLRDSIIMDPISFFVTPATRVICKHEESKERGETYFHEDEVQRECKKLYSSDWETMITTGMVNGKLLQALVVDQHEVKISLMIKFGLIVHISSQKAPSMRDNIYLVPSLLHSMKDDAEQTILSMPPNELQNSFFFSFYLPTKTSMWTSSLTESKLATAGYLPHGLFLRYLGKLFTFAQRLKLDYNPMSKQIFNDYAVILFGQRTFRIVLLDEYNTICVTVLKCRNYAALLQRLKYILNDVIRECFGLLKYEVLLFHSETVGRETINYYIPFDLVKETCKINHDLIVHEKLTLKSEVLMKSFSKWWELHNTTQDCDVFLSTKKGETNVFVFLIYEALLDCDYCYVFHDDFVKIVGQNHKNTLSKALITAKIFVPFCSHDALIRMKDHNPEVVDNVLLEWILALECAEKHSLKILSIPYGSIDNSSNLTDFNRDGINSLPEIIPTKTMNEAVKLLKLHGITPGPELSTLTVRDIVTNIFGFECQFEPKQVEASVDRCIKDVQEIYPNVQEIYPIEKYSSDSPLYCFICRCEAPSSKGIKCNKCNSFVCDCCFNSQVNNQINIVNFGRFKQSKGKIVCKNLNCNNKFTFIHIEGHCNEDTYNLYCDAYIKAIGQIAVDEQLPVLEEQWLAKHKSEAYTHYHNIMNSILTLCCPSCGTSFLFNPNDCLALLCSHCNKHFCGWCLKSCGNSSQAHDHIINVCTGKLYCTKDEFEQEHDERKMTKLRIYLESIQDTAIKKKVVDLISIQLSVKAKKALGIESNTFNNDDVQRERFFNLDVSQLQYEKSEVNLVVKGSFGDVYYGEWCGELCVVECLNDLMSVSTDLAKQIYNEKEITEVRNHANLHKIIGVSLKERLVVSKPYDTSLFNFLYVKSTVNSVMLSTKLKLSIIKDIVCAIEYLHDNDVIHGDLRPNNILLVFKVGEPVPVTAQITGFGVTSSLKNLNQSNQSNSSRSRHTSFSCQYMAPEALEGYPAKSPTFTPSSDIYALGVTINEIMTEMIPWTTPMAPDDISEIIKGKRPLLFSYFAKADMEVKIGELIGDANNGCLSGNSSERPSAKKLFKDINNLNVHDSGTVTEEPMLKCYHQSHCEGEVIEDCTINKIPIMEDSEGLFLQYKDSLNTSLCYILRGSELFLFAHYYRDIDSMSKMSYDYVVGNMVLQVAPGTVDVDTGYVINNTYKVMKDALGLYTIDKGVRIYGNDLLIFARYFCNYKNDEMSVKSCLFILDSYPKVVSIIIKSLEKHESEVVMRAPNVNNSIGDNVCNSEHQYVTFGFFSTGLDGELHAERDRIVIKEYSKAHNHFGGSIIFDGNSGFKENVIVNLTSRYLPSAQFRKSECIICFGGHGDNVSGDFLITPPYYYLGNENITFDDFMDAVNNYNDKFSPPRVKMHIVLFSCYSGHWIEKLKTAREKDPTAYPDIGIIITAADNTHECYDDDFAQAFWGKRFGRNNITLDRARESKPQKYISLANCPASPMTEADFSFQWFRNGHHWSEHPTSASEGAAAEEDTAASKSTVTVNIHPVITGSRKNIKTNLVSAWGSLLNPNMVMDEDREALKTMIINYQLEKSDDLLECDDSTIIGIQAMLKKDRSNMFKCYVDKAKMLSRQMSTAK